MNAEEKLLGELHALAVVGEVIRLRAALPVLLELYPLLAQVQHARYTSLVDAGFTEQQAMFLLTTPTR